MVRKKLRLNWCGVVLLFMVFVFCNNIVFIIVVVFNFKNDEMFFLVCFVDCEMLSVIENVMLFEFVGY